jgi:hypothetical protein
MQSHAISCNLMYLDPKMRAEADHALRAPDLVVSPRLRWHLEAIRVN